MGSSSRDLIPEVPPLGPVRRLARLVRQAPRRLTSGWRGLPDFLIIGAQRAGTSSLRDHLARQPDMFLASPKEVHYFDLHFGRGSSWYRAHFPLGESSSRLRGEATPYYAFHPCAPARVHALVPDVKLVFLARDPVERAISHHRLETKLGFEELPLLEALEMEEERTSGEEERLRSGELLYSHGHHHFAYTARGMYAQQLRDWYEFFPPEQMLIMSSEKLFERPAEEVARLRSFLGLPGAARGELPRHNALSSRPVDPEARRLLRSRLEPHYPEFYELAGEDLGWESTHG